VSLKYFFTYGTLNFTFLHYITHDAANTSIQHTYTKKYNIIRHS